MSRMQRKRMTRQQMMRMFIVTAVLIVIAVIFLFRNRVVADEPAQTPLYRTVTVEKGDSLWSIAEEFAPDTSNSTLSSYVDNIRSINKLRRDAPLQVGQNLLVVYYNGNP